MSEEQKYLAIYADRHHEEVELGELLNKGGAAGKIYLIKNKPECVAKIFHDKSKSENNRKKLEAMLQNKPDIPTISYEGKEYIQIAWPFALLEDKTGFCTGYLMPLIDTEQAVSLDHLIQKAVRRRLGLSERYIDRVFAAYNITSVVAALHACGHYIIDLKPSNVSIYKKTMLVALFDCDGFSIRGSGGEHYPAEYVSEEYICPEDMKITCDKMGEEQDEFALAVIIFKLLNEGIHPFSGTPRKKDDMLSIQERIAGYHYAYGIWPDTYQQPHPYSIHDYFDKTTMNLFERAFTKGNQRPTALEWQNQLEYIWKHSRQCKKNRNHAYFTSKGCGLCMIDEKFNEYMKVLQKQQEEPQTVHGMDISSLSAEKIKENQRRQESIQLLQHRGSYVFLAVYMIFFALLFKLLEPFGDSLRNLGIFTQFMFVVIGSFAANRLVTKLPEYLPELKNQNLASMLKIYAFTCLLITFIFLNRLSFQIFAMAQ